MSRASVERVHLKATPEESRTAILRVLAGGGWVAVSALKAADIPGVSTFNSGYGTLARLVREGLVMARDGKGPRSGVAVRLAAGTPVPEEVEATPQCVIAGCTRRRVWRKSGCCAAHEAHRRATA